MVIAGIIGLVILIAVFSYIGYSVIKKKESIGFAAKSGVIAGALVGLVSAILGIVSLYYFPAVFTETIKQMVSQGMAKDAAENMLKIGIYAGFITGPIFNAVIGAGISAFSAWITRR